MKNKKKMLMSLIAIIFIIVLLLQISLYVGGQIMIPHSKNPIEQTYSISTIARPYFLHGKPDEIDNSLKEMTGEKILVYKNVKLGSYGNADIKYYISENNALHEVNYYFIDGFEQSEMIDKFKSKLSSKYVETKEDDYYKFSTNNSSGIESIYINEGNRIIIEYFC